MAYDHEKRYRSIEPTFHFHFSSLSLIHLESFHHDIAQELFHDGIITWTRIITFISFSALLAERLIHQQPQNMDLIISSMIDWTTNFIDTDLHVWLENENYWVRNFKTNENLFLRFSFFKGWFFEAL
jgi:predicted helicase